MTMLDRMRRHRNWLKWSLGLVVLAFVVFYIPDFLSDTAIGTGVAAGDTIATVDGEAITAGEFRRTYQAQVQAYRNAYGGSMSEQLLKQLGIEQQILQQMVDERAALSEADRVGIAASDEEVRQRVLSVPAFQENGVFIGAERYQQLLRAQRPPMTPGEFEETVRRQIVVEKLRAAVTEWLSATEQEIEQEYRRRNDKVKLALVSLTAESFRKDVSASDAEVASHFDAHKETFTIPERRKLRYLLIDVDALRAKLPPVPPTEVERAYNTNIDQYTTPEQVRASHILLETEGKDEAAVKAKAEALIKQAKAGADFAELAKKNSEDEASATNGGDLDYFGRGRMVAEFDQAAFAMQPGQISDQPVRTEFGFHIIKLVDKKAAATRTLAEVSQQLTEQIAYETATAQATTLADTIANEIRRPTDLDRAASRHGLAVAESGLFARDEPVLALGASPEATTRAFEMTSDQVAGPIRSSRGFVFLSLAGSPQAAYVPKLEDVKDRVRDEVIRNKARELGKQKATELAARLKAAPDFERAAKAAGVEAKTTDLITRDAPLPDLGISTTIGETAFSLPVGSVSEVVETENGAAVVKILEKQEVTPTEWLVTKDRFRGEFLAERRNRFFNAYMEKAKKERMRIEIDFETLRKTVG